VNFLISESLIEILKLFKSIAINPEKLKCFFMLIGCIMKTKLFIVLVILARITLIYCSENSANSKTSQSSDNFVWCHIAAGDYTWGKNSSIQTIDYDYQIMKYELTNSQYLSFLQEAYASGKIKVSDGGDIVQGYYSGDEYYPEGYYDFYSLGDNRSENNYGRISWNGETFVVNVPAGYNEGDFDDHPVVFVTWFGALAFADYYGLRLPTEQEWEKAARGNTGQEYPWGNALSADKANYRNSEDPWDNGTTPVGYYNGQNKTSDSPSPYGVYDMCGNVYDWTDSWYGESNPSYRIIRGGYWYNFSVHPYLRSWYRVNNNPAGSDYNVGFRCVKIP
jgi:formylglycine-generating enzyme required for sulfatase activity